MEGKCRPKISDEKFFSEGEVSINFRKNQIWEFEYVNSGVEIKKNGVTIYSSVENFKEYFEVVKGEDVKCY